MRFCLRWVLPVAFLAAAAAAPAQLLKPGGKAPEVKVGSWLKGKPFESFAKSELTVIEFWSTTCAPCIAQMPHLTEMAMKYEGRVSFYGFARKEFDGEELGKTKKFVAEMGGKMDYNVAIDTDDAFMRKAWMAAAGIQTIPTIFLVDAKGTILWVDWDSAALEKAIREALGGRFDLRASIARFDIERATESRNRSIFSEIDAAETLFGEGKKAEALKKLEGIDLGDFKRDSGFHQRWGRAKLRILLDDPGKASEYVDELIQAGGPASVRVLSSAGFSATPSISTESKAVIVRAMEAAQKLEPKNPLVFYETGSGWLSLGDRKRATADLTAGEKLLRDNPDLPQSLQSFFDNLRIWIKDYEAFPCRS